jgi:hypothetical protein
VCLSRDIVIGRDHSRYGDFIASLCDAASCCACWKNYDVIPPSHVVLHEQTGCSVVQPRGKAIQPRGKSFQAKSFDGEEEFETGKPKRKRRKCSNGVDGEDGKEGESCSMMEFWVHSAMKSEIGNGQLICEAKVLGIEGDSDCTLEMESVPCLYPYCKIIVPLMCIQREKAGKGWIYRIIRHQKHVDGHNQSMEIHSMTPMYGYGSSDGKEREERHVHAPRVSKVREMLDVMETMDERGSEGDIQHALWNLRGIVRDVHRSVSPHRKEGFETCFFLCDEKEPQYGVKCAMKETALCTFPLQRGMVIVLELRSPVKSEKERR